MTSFQYYVMKSLLRREVDGFFKILDRDLDGKLSFSEFLGEDSHIERIFKLMDKDNDGFVTKKVSEWLSGNKR